MIIPLLGNMQNTEREMEWNGMEWNMEGSNFFVIK